jgi:hypothetical protein
LKLRSTELDWFMLREYVASIVVLKRLFRIAPLQLRFDRRLRWER